MDQPEFGKQLSEIRKALGLTQAELAEQCGVSLRTIQRIEVGTVSPRSFTIKAIGSVLQYDFFEKPINAAQPEVYWQWSVLNSQLLSHISGLFNLKSNPMKKLTFLTLVVALIVFTFFSFSKQGIAQQQHSDPTNFLTQKTPYDISKREAIKQIKELKAKTGFHTKPLELLMYYTENSSSNYDTYVLLAKLVASFEHSTFPVMEIAHVAFFTYEECDLLNEIAPLIFLDGQHTEQFVKLAKEAETATNNNKRQYIRKQIDTYKQQSKFTSLQEAFDNQLGK